MIVAKFRHIRALRRRGHRYCLPGVAEFCLQHGLNMRDLAETGPGIPVEVLRNTGDLLAIQIAEEAEREHGLQ